MGCCGKGASIKGNKTQAFASGALKAEVDMSESSLVKYVGRRSVGSSFNVYGFATSTQYRVKVGQDFYVANEDLISTKKGEGILQKYEGTDFAYVLVEVEPEPEPIAEPEAIVEEVVEVVQPFSSEIMTTEVNPDTTVTIETLEVKESFDFSVADTNLTALKMAIRDNGYSITELNGLLAYERSHKNRQSGISAIESAIENLVGFHEMSEETLDE